MNKVNQLNCPYIKFFGDEVTAAGSCESIPVSGYSSLQLQVAGFTSCSIKVQGCINFTNTSKEQLEDDDITWEDLSTINLNGFEVADAIADNGLFLVVFQGCIKLRVVVESLSGTGTITGTLR